VRQTHEILLDPSPFFVNAHVPTLTAGVDTVVVSSRYLRGLGIAVICTVVAYPVYPNFDPVNIAMIYLLGTTVAALLLGRGPSALTAIANTVAFDYFFVPPRYSFYIAEPQYLFTLGVMLGVALVIANLVVSVRRQTLAAAERERRTALLYAVSRELTGAPDSVAIAEVAARHVVAALGGASVVLPANARGVVCGAGSSPATDLQADRCIAQWVLDNDRGAGLGMQHAAQSDSLYLPLSVRGRALGVLVVKPAERGRLHLEQQFLEALAGQVALALERVRLAELAAESRAAAERAALRNTLLASISHDLRGPLSAIAGAGSLVAQSSGTLDRHRRTTLGQLIEEKARDMTDLLTNVLELMRLETSTGPVKADWQSVEELFGTAVRNNEHRLGGWRLMTAVPEGFPLIYVDAQLLVQLLSNLIENATKHTPPGSTIVIVAALRDSHIRLVVEDDGPGFGVRDPEALFEKFERGQAESHISGVGLGLAICRAIVHWHGGRIRAVNRPTGGARFEIDLPAASLPPARASGCLQ
jgi:two-component system, OmpR family, sensor histidine kinase KdpD